MFGVERIGQFNVTKMGDDRYAVAVNNGNMGAFMTNKAGVEELRKKYNKETDTVELSTKKLKTHRKKKLKRRQLG